MEKVLKIVSLKDAQSDFNYWNEKPIIERLNAIEILRQQYIQFNSDVQPRLQRFCRIINQTRG